MSSPSIQRRQFSVVSRWLMLVVVCLSAGCVSRRMTIRTNPPGALVEVNGKRIGTSPASMDFTYYGVYEFRISAPGYETMVVEQAVRPPWYQVPPADLISDNFLGAQVTNRHQFTYNLVPTSFEAGDHLQLQDRGQNFRSRARSAP
ncbi:MAG: PEGA domain-containing protein [Planctomycetaceae bacterium]